MALFLYIPVDEFSADTAFEEAAAAVTRQNAVVFATGGVATHEACQTWWTALHQRRRQTGIDCASAGADRCAPPCRGRCRHGSLVEHHSVNHGGRQHRGRGGLWVLREGRRSWRTCERRHGVIGQVRMVMMMTVQGGWGWRWTDLRISCGWVTGWWWRGRTFQAARHDRTNWRNASTERP